MNRSGLIMWLKPDEFIRRFLLHALPDGFHRIRHFGFLANGHRARRLALCRSLLADKAGPMANGEEEPSSTGPSANVAALFWSATSVLASSSRLLKKSLAARITL